VYLFFNLIIYGDPKWTHKDTIISYFDELTRDLSILCEIRLSELCIRVPSSLSWSHHLERFTVTTMTLLTAMEYLCHKWPRIYSTCRKHFPVLSPFMTYHRFITRLTRRVSLVEQELLTLPEHMSVHPVISEVHVARSLILCVMFCTSLFVLLSISFWSLFCLSFFDVWILITSLWYLQALHTDAGSRFNLIFACAPLGAQ
jgi:hypothetical protein